MQYSIWIIPPEPVYSQLKNIISTLSTRYRGPAFEPHMTVLGNIDQDLPEIEKKMSELTRGKGTLKLSLGPVSFSTTYFQSVFVRVNSTAPLMQLNLDAKKLFSMQNTVFMPHISLIYGEHDMVVREEAESKIELPKLSFTADKLVVTPATSDPHEWKQVATAFFLV